MNCIVKRLLVGFYLATMLVSVSSGLDRTWQGGNLDWVDNGSTANWNPADEPDSDDTAIFNTANTVNLGSNNSITALTMSGGIDLLTNGNQLLVAGQTGVAGSGTTLRIDPHAIAGTVAFQSPEVVVKSSGALVMNGGIALVSTLLDVNAGSTLSGFGTVNVGNINIAATMALDNSGLIQVVGNTAAPQTLTIHANGLLAIDTIDLDGSAENGIVDVDNAVANTRADTLTLVIDGPLSDAFGGTLQIGQRDTATFNDNFTMDGADVLLAGGNNMATMNGPGAVTSVINSTVMATGAAVIANNMTFTGAANTVTISASSSLNFAGAVTMPATTLHMADPSSELIVTGDLVVNDPTQAFDWDGPGFTMTTISGSGFIGITADKVDSGSNGYGGTLNLNDDADLAIHNTANEWNSSGAINKNNSGASTISGARVIVQGDLNVNAGSLTMPATTLDHNSNINVAGFLALGTSSEFDGPLTLGGAGTLQMAGTSTVTSDTTIAVATFDWDGTTTGTTHTINAGATLTINSTTFDSDGDMDDPIALVGGGSGLIVNGPSQWIANAAINANTSGSGNAVIGGTSRLVLSGAGAVLNVHGNMTITAPLTFGPGSSANIDAAKSISSQAEVIYAGGTISGAGIFSGGVSNIVTADTLINVNTFDFDGGTWTVESGSHLTFHVTEYDATSNSPFGSAVTLNNSVVLADSARPEFVMNGELNMNATGGGDAEWSGDAIDIGNDGGTLDADLNVAGDGNVNSQSRILPPIRFLSDADVDIAAGGVLKLLSTVTFDTVNGVENAEFTGAGSIEFESIVQVREAVALNLVGGTIDLDGNDTTGDFINIDAPLTIHAASLSNFGRINSSGGTNTLDVDARTLGTSGSLSVVLDNPTDRWTLNTAGVMNLAALNTGATLLAGNGVNVNGSLFVTGDVRTTAPLHVAGTVAIVTTGEPLRLAGGAIGNDNTLAGGTVNGPGILGAEAGKTLRGFGSINATIDFDDSAALLAESGQMTVSSSIVDVGTIGANAGGILNVVTAWNTNVANAVILSGGELKGGTVTVGGAAVTGHGLVSARVVNSGSLNANAGGTLVVETAGNDNDWDGAANNGNLAAIGAGSVLELRDNAVFGFTGTVTSMSSARVFTKDFALDFNPGSLLQLQDSTYDSTKTTDIGGTVTTLAGITQQSTIRVADNQSLTFEPTSSTTLAQNLRIENNAIQVAAGATFAGGGALIIPDGSKITTASGSNIDVAVHNEGDLQITAIGSVGLTTIKDFQQSTSGDTFLDIAGTLFNQFDRLAATGQATLDGNLHLSIAGGFIPTLGNTFNVVTATAGLNGQFDTVDVVGMPAGLFLQVNYFPTTVQLQVVNTPSLPGDFDHDGDVDPTDLAIWQNAYNLNQLGDADGDNDSDGRDFLIWQRQFGAAPLTALTAESTAVPEPSSFSLVLLTALMGFARSWIRQS